MGGQSGIDKKGKIMRMSGGQDGRSDKMRKLLLSWKVSREQRQIYIMTDIY